MESAKKNIYSGIADYGAESVWRTLFAPFFRLHFPHCGANFILFPSVYEYGTSGRHFCREMPHFAGGTILRMGTPADRTGCGIGLIRKICPYVALNKSKKSMWNRLKKIFTAELLTTEQKAFGGRFLFASFVCTFPTWDQALFFFLLFMSTELLVGIFVAKCLTLRAARFCGWALPPIALVAALAVSMKYAYIWR